MLIHYPSALFILCISVAVRWKMKCFGLGWKRKRNLVLSPWIWIFLYQCQVSPLTNKWMYVTKFSSLDHAIFRCCNVTWHVTCDGCDTMHSIFFASQDTILHYITQHLLCWRRSDNWYWIGRSEEFLLVLFPVKLYIGLILQYNHTFNWYWIDV